MTNSKLISISPWFLVINIVYQVVIGWIVFIFLSALAYMFEFPPPFSQLFSFGGSSIYIIIAFTNSLLYWLHSGIFVSAHGDHLVKQGGWFVKEDRLLNSVVISSQIKRNPLDLLFGMASIQTGLFSHKLLKGVRYKDIQNYDATMRGGMHHSHVSMF